MNRMLAAAAALGAVLNFGTSHARSDDCPVRLMRMVVPFAPGGVLGILGGSTAEHMKHYFASETAKYAKLVHASKATVE